MDCSERNKVRSEKKLMIDPKQLRRIQDLWIMPSLLPKNPLVLNLGSRIGEWAIPFVEHYGGKQVCYDPLEKFTTSLKRIVAEKELAGHFEIHNQAVFDCDGQVDFYETPDRPNILSQSSFFFSEVMKTTIPVKVSCISINTATGNMKRTPDVLKMDIEGSEYKIIEAMELSVLESILQITMEAHSYVDDSYSMVDFLEENGFVTHATGKWEGTYGGRNNRFILGVNKRFML